MIKETNQKKKKKRNDGVTCERGSLETADRNAMMDTAANFVPGATTDQGMGGEEGNVDEPRVGYDMTEANEDVALRCPHKEVEEDSVVFLLTEELTDLENKINTNSVIHAFKTLDTRVHSCAICKRQLLQFSLAVHHHETHEMHVQEECEYGGAWSAAESWRYRRTVTEAWGGGRSRAGVRLDVM